MGAVSTDSYAQRAMVYSLYLHGGLHVLYDDQQGSFAGVLTCLMGVSGAGKTTLMDVLAGRKTGEIHTPVLMCPQACEIATSVITIYTAMLVHKKSALDFILRLQPICTSSSALSVQRIQRHLWNFQSSSALFIVHLYSRDFRSWLFLFLGSDVNRIIPFFRMSSCAKLAA